MEERNRLLFFENDIDVFLSRHYTSPCSDLDRLKFVGLDYCSSKSARKSFDESFEQLQRTCTRTWQQAVFNLTRITMTQPHSVPQLRAQAARLNANYEHSARATRSVTAAGIVTGIGILSTLVSSITTTVSTIFHFFKSREMAKNSHTMYIKSRGASLAAAEIAENTVSDLKTISQALCDENFHTNQAIAEMYVNIILRESVRSIELEVLHFNFGTIPKTSSFLSTLLKLCKEIEPNVEDFCKHLIYAGGIKLEFRGLTIKNGFLVSLVKVNVPIQSILFMENKHIEIINLGSYLGGRYFQVDLPRDIIIDNDGTFYSLNRALCSGPCCDINSVMVTEGARCLSNIVSNKTQFCTTMYMSPPRDCSFRKVNMGTMIRAESGVFFPIGSAPFGAFSINKKAHFTSSKGRLLCKNSGGYNTTHIITPGFISLRHNSSVRIDPLIKINRKFNFTETDFMLSETLELAKKIKNLYSIEDTINIGGTEHPILISIIWISSVIFLICFIILVCFYYGKDLINFTQDKISKFWGLSNNKKSINKKLDDKIDTNETELTLINAGKHAIYPELQLEEETQT